MKPRELPSADNRIYRASTRSGEMLANVSSMVWVDKNRTSLRPRKKCRKSGIEHVWPNVTTISSLTLEQFLICGPEGVGILLCMGLRNLISEPFNNNKLQVESGLILPTTCYNLVVTSSRIQLQKRNTKTFIKGSLKIVLNFL